MARATGTTQDPMSVPITTYLYTINVSIHHLGEVCAKRLQPAHRNGDIIPDEPEDAHQNSPGNDQASVD